MKCTTLGLLCATTALAGTAAAAQQAYDLGTIVLSPSFTPVQLGRTGTTVEILDDETQNRDTRLMDRLERLPGITANSNGGLGASADVRIRGLPGRYVGVRINGIDVSDPSSTQNQFDFGGLTSSGLGRVEVLKGSQSALYGSEAIAGVIDITTFRPERLGFSGAAQLEGGRYDTYSGTLSAGYKTERGEIALSYGRIETDGFSTQSFNTEDDGFEQSTVTLSGEYEATDAITMGGSLFYREGEVEIDRSRFPPQDVTGRNDTEELGARVFTQFDAGPIVHTLSYSHFDIQRDDPEGFTKRFTGERQEVSYLGSADLGTRMVLNFGADYTTEDFTADEERGSNDNTALNAELLMSPTDRIDISAALRYDDNSDFDGKTTGRLAAVWRPVDDIAFRAVVGTGYRAPSLYERFGQYGVATLRPEESRSYELGLEKTLARDGFVKATIFYTEIDDLIDFDLASAACGNPFGCYNQVPGTLTARGIEVSGELAVTAGLSVFGAYTYTDATDGDQRAARSPKHDIVMGLNNTFTDRLDGYVDVRHVADVLPSAFAPADNKVGNYTLVGAGVSYDVTDSTELYLRIENLFDEDYETVGGFNQPGRAAYAGIHARF